MNEKARARRDKERLHQKQLRRPRGAAWALSGFFSFLMFCALAAGGGWAFFQYTVQNPGPAVEETNVLIRPGSGLGTIAGVLENAGVITDSTTFQLAVKAAGLSSRLRAGEYAIPAKASVQQVIDVLVSGKAIQHRITIQEGLTVAEVLQRIRENDILTGDISLVPPEGAVRPDTYLFQRGDKRDGVLQRMMDAQAQSLQALWEARDPDLPISTRDEALIVASLVETEAQLAAERPRIAAVYLNRLRRGMKMQADPTVIYGATNGATARGYTIKRSDLDAVNPYNTYQVEGLPPTPIANPGEASIAAVLKPAKTNELFFVADGTGGHAFAETVDEHNRNVARWRQIEAQRRAAGQGN